MLKVTVNQIIIEINPNSSVLQACQAASIQVPKFCFHDRLLIAGNCRICLVEVNKFPKPVAACAIPVSEGIMIFTTTPLVRKARENVLEFLLLHHPLDCPICDQGSECDLQDQAISFGSEKSRFFFIKKRSVTLKNWGPLINTVITRCIHCTRCTRFITSYSGFSYLGILGRGVQSEISFFIKKKAQNIFSGNLIDLCPVGLITKKNYTILCLF
jgi:NADH dehydrogenase/NADH:ubiquinone oxidoreductase subunit G